MLQGFLHALSTLTFFSRSGDTTLSAREHLWFLISFPLIGVLFGFLAMTLVRGTYLNLPVFTAWAIPLLWLALTSGAHFIGLCLSMSVLLCPGNKQRCQEIISSEQVTVTAGALAVILFSGKVFALLQAQVLDIRAVALLVLLIPLISRYAALLLVLEHNSFRAAASADDLPSKPAVIIGASLIVVLLSMLCLTLGLLLLVTALLTTAIVRLIAQNKLGMIPPPVVGAAIDLSEMLMLWIPVICGALGLNLLAI